MRASRLIVEMQACRSRRLSGWLGRELHGAFGGDPAPYGAGQPGAAVAPGGARLHPRRGGRDDLPGPRHPALPAGAGADRRRPAGGRPARRLGEGLHGAAGHRAAGRRARLPAGHPLVRRPVRLLPQLHAGRDGGGAAHGRGPARHARPGRGAGARRPRTRCSRGCGRMCTARAAGTASTRCCAAPPASALDPAWFERTSPSRYLRGSLRTRLARTVRAGACNR